MRSLVELHSPALVRYAASIIRDGDGARDVVQETFVRLWREPRASVEKHVVPWMFRVCRHRALDRLRKEGRMNSFDAYPAVADSDNGQLNPDALVEVRDSYARVLELMEDLPENQREVVRLKFQTGLSYKEISAVTDLTVTNVGFLLHTALKTLRNRLAMAGE